MEKLQGIADTLYIPLVARIIVSKQFPDYFRDAKALELEANLPAKWQHIMLASREYENMASVARYYNIDDMTRRFIARNERCNIIHLGAGLDTSYHRIKPTSAKFYEVDLPDVIALRRELLGETDGEILLGEDMFEIEWAEKIDCSLPTLFVASGVFQYFPHDRLTDFVQKLGKNFQKAELIFDATNQVGIHVANFYVRHLGNHNAPMPFYVNRARTFARETGTTLLESRPFFTETRRMLGHRLTFFTRMAMLIGDKFKMSKLIHLRLGQEEMNT